MKKIHGYCTLQTTSENSQPNSNNRIWDNVKTVLDFDKSHIVCYLKLNLPNRLSLSFNDNVTIKDLVVDYKGFQYKAILENSNIELKSFSPSSGGDCVKSIDKESICKLEFLLLKSVLTFELGSAFQGQRIVFSGNIFSEDFSKSIKLFNRTIAIKADSSTGEVAISSLSPLTNDEIECFHFAYSLFQCSELCWLEKIDAGTLELYLQRPYTSGNCLAEDSSLLESFLSYFTNNLGEFKKHRNGIRFLLAGMRIRVSVLEFRTISFFIFINEICGKGKFGELIAKHFNISNGDGEFLAKVRNNLLHEGDELGKAIVDGVEEVKKEANNLKQSNKIELTYIIFKDFINHQIPAEDTASCFYLMLYDLCMDFWIKKLGYTGQIRKMVDIYKLR